MTHTISTTQATARRRRTTLRCAAAAAFAAAAIGVAASPALAEAPAPGPDLTPANAAALLPSGYVRSGNDYVYDGGSVIVTPVDDATFGAAAKPDLPCTNGYLCLYRDTYWHGDRWQFRDHYWQDLNPYGASDQVSSWRNYESRTAYLGWNSIAQGIGSKLALSAHAQGSSIGSWNDKASSVLP